MAQIKNSRILITGGAGLIGSHIADLLQEEAPAEIVVLDNFVRGTRRNLEKAIAHGNVTIIEGDIRDRRLVSDVMQGIDVVFHQAAIRITQCAQEPRLAMEVLADGTFNVLEAAANSKVKKVVAASSASVYGLAEQFPTTESHHPYNNRTLYGAAKVFNEGLLRSFNDMCGLPYVALRYFNVYGPRMDTHGAYTEVLIRWMTNINAGLAPKIFGDGKQTMDFVFAPDIARANILAAKADVSDEVFNIASGTETSLNDLAGALLRVMGADLPLEYGPERKTNPVPRRLADIEKARRLLGFKAQVGLEEGLRRLVNWWRAAGSEEPAGNALPRRIEVAKPVLGEPEIEAVRKPILSGWVTQGPEVAAFEKEFATFVNAPHACAVSSCTSALHLALLAVGVQPGDEVITVSHSFIATANSIRYCGAKPVFVDIQPGTFNLDPDRLERVITPRTRAILAVHQMGMPCDLTSILAIARKHGIPVIEDAACAAGSEILWNGAWERIGKPHGDIACFSFHPRKLITTGDGGMITTHRADFDAKFRLGRQHGMDLSDTVRHSTSQIRFESYPELGYNYRMTDIQAAIGREQLRRLPELVDRRRAVARRYSELLAGATELRLPEQPEWARSNWQSYCVRLPDGIVQHEVMQSMLDAGISTRRGIMCSHREPAYAVQPWSCGPEERCNCPRGSCENLKLSEQAQDRCILLPLYADLTEQDQNRTIEALLTACSVRVPA